MVIDDNTAYQGQLLPGGSGKLRVGNTPCRYDDEINTAENAITCSDTYEFGILCLDASEYSPCSDF